MASRKGTSIQTLLDTSNPLDVDEYDTDLEGELAEKQRETYTQINAYDHYCTGCTKKSDCSQVHRISCQDFVVLRPACYYYLTQPVF